MTDPLGSAASFNGFCSYAKTGNAIRALYLTPDKESLQKLKLDMFNTVTARGLNILWSSAGRCLEIGQSKAVLRVVHPRLCEELAGLEWHWIHGLEHLDKFENGSEMASKLMAQVRL